MAAAIPDRRSPGGGIRAKLSALAANWARRRQGIDHLPVLINTRRVYILPTRAGLAFAALLFVMLMAGLNYGNSIALVITFLLAGFALIAMHLCHRNLAGISLRAIATVDGFAGEHGHVLLTIENTADSPRLGIEAVGNGTSSALLDVPPGSNARADLALPLEKRGMHRLGRVRLATSFPFGLFRAWTWIHAEVVVLAWPTPRGRQPPPTEASSGGEAPAVHRAGDEEWAGLREFRTGDSPRQVAWQAYARGRGLLVKTYQSPAAHHRIFELTAVAGGDLEPRLEQLCAWVVGAHARGERYGLRVGAVEIAPGSGSEHRAQCLNTLARHG